MHARIGYFLARLTNIQKMVPKIGVNDPALTEIEKTRQIMLGQMAQLKGQRMRERMPDT